jgi:hypothetical protein
LSLVFRNNELGHDYLVNGSVCLSHAGVDASAYLAEAATGLGQSVVFLFCDRHMFACSG